MNLEKIARTTFFIGAIGVSTGCYTQKPVPFFEVDAMPYICQSEDVRIGAMPVTGELSERIYGKEVEEKGYLPFIVHVENDGTDSIVIRKGSMQFYDLDGNRFFLSSGLEMAEDFNMNPILSTALSSAAPGIAKGFVKAAMEKSRQDRRYGYFGIELPPTITVGANESAYGTVVLKNPNIKKPIDVGESGTFRAVVERNGNSQEIHSKEK